MITINSFGQVKGNQNPTVISIKEGLKRKMFEFKMTGVSDPEIYFDVIDRDGIHYGKCMSIILMSKIDSMVLLKLDSGTELIPTDSAFQTMIVTKTVELPLYPGQTYLTRFYAMCGQLHDDPPFVHSDYKFGPMADRNVVKLAKYCDEKYLQSMVGQHALWAYTDNADFKELKKYGADSTTLALTTKMLDELAIVTKLNPKIKSNQILTKDTFEGNLLIYYAAAILFIVLMSTCIVLIISLKSAREKIKDNNKAI